MLNYWLMEYHRTVGAAVSATEDEVTITPGSPGAIRYQLNSTSGIAPGSNLMLRIGNHTSLALPPGEFFSTTTGTTTTPGDAKPIINSPDTGAHSIDVRLYNDSAVEVANAGFVVYIIDTIEVGPVDTTEEVPPFRFNGQPTGQLSGTTINVEISLETDEFAIWRYATTAGVSYK